MTLPIGIQPPKHYPSPNNRPSRAVTASYTAFNLHLNRVHMTYTVVLPAPKSQENSMSRASKTAGFASCTLFILLGVLIIPYAGIQADEALFSAPLFPYVPPGISLPLVPNQVPLMVMTYIGSLKTVLYWPIFRALGTGVWTLRFPVVLLGAVTIFIFFTLARDSVGAQAAATGSLLLATDPVFLLTDTFDWGPVALEHALLVTGCYLVYRFARDTNSRSRLWTLAGGFLCWGLALWNKAIFIWALTGLFAGGVLVFWPEIKRCLTPRTAVIAAGAFLCGALPLIVYNFSHSSATVTENARLDPRSVPGKWIQIERAANGTSLFNYMVGENWWPNPKRPRSVPGQVAGWISEHLGEHRRTGFYYALGILLLAAPWWWKYRSARFSLVFLAVTWLMMALTRDAGGSAHHVILLWPFPILFASVALASLPWRRLAWMAAAILIMMNLLVVNQYVAQFDRDGPGEPFTDALNPLSAALDNYADRDLYVIDWGMYENLNLLHQGRLKLRFWTGPLSTDSPSPDQLGEIRDVLQDRGGLILDHIPEHEVFPNVGARLDRAARSMSYHRESVAEFSDSNGRPMFEIHRYVPSD
jgi:Dolichyl-phosphate-mannose-protein mannosyltransferase